MTKPTLRTGSEAEILQLIPEIPEWNDPYQLSVRGREAIPDLAHILIVDVERAPAGFRAGYATEDHAFRIWLAAVLPRYRRQGLARLMAGHQEQWLRSNGYREIRTYTRRSNEAMLKFLSAHGYERADCGPPNRDPGDWVDFRKLL